jgi:CBS domain-containing protein
VGGITDDAALLRAHPPFSELGAEALRDLLAASEVVAFSNDALVLEEGGAPADALYVVREGSIELVREGEVVDVLGPGETFGFPSLVTGDHPAFDVRAHGATACIRIERTAAERWLGSAPGLRFLAVGMRQRSELAEEADRTALVRSIDAAQRTEELVTLAAGVPRVIADLHDAGLGVRALGREIVRVIDATTIRAIDLHLREREPPPAPWAWLAFGSVARRESGMAPDQDHTIVWDGDDTSDAYFADLAEAVTATLEASGMPRCPSGVLATTPGWRAPLDRWLGSLLAPSAKSGRAVFRLALALDLRKVAGPLRIDAAAARLHAGLREPDVRWRVARLAIDARPPIGSFGGLETERRGRHRVVDVKRGGLLAVTDLARVAASDGGIDEISTVPRLRRSAEVGTLHPDAARALEEAFETFGELRFDHQVASFRRGRPADSLVEPASLDPVSRIRLREAFRVVDAAQADLRTAVGGGRFRLPASG